MAKFKNVSPLGALDVDLIDRRGIKVGEVFEVRDDFALAFLGQDGTFEAVEVSDEIVAEWEAAIAADSGVVPDEVPAPAPEPFEDPNVEVAE